MTHIYIIILFVLSYLAYFCLSNSHYLFIIMTRHLEQDRKTYIWVLFQRSVGLLFLGLLPALITLFLLAVSLYDFGFSAGVTPTVLLWSLGLGFCVIIINYFAAGKPDNIEVSPQIRIKNWSFSIFIINAFSWTAYLLAYEFLFRGLLLFSLLEVVSYWPAILISTFVYSLVHYPKGYKQTVGAIPFGIVLCLLTIETGSIWIAFFVHVMLALSNDHFALRANRTMSYTFTKCGGVKN